MGAELDWTERRGADRVAALRFGPRFQAAARRDPYAGCGVVEGFGELCCIGPLAGALERADYGAILEACRAAGFRLARVVRHGAAFEYDLARGLFVPRRLEQGAP